MTTIAPYNLLVEGALILVGPGDFNYKDDKPIQSDSKDEQCRNEAGDELVLAVLQEKALTVAQAPKLSGAYNYLEISKQNFADIRAGKHEALLEFLKDPEATLRTLACMDYVNEYYDILHLCALGGFRKSLEYLQKLELREKYTKYDPADEGKNGFTLGEVAAMGGHYHMLDLVAKNMSDRNMVTKAKLSGDDKFVHKVKWLYGDQKVPVNKGNFMKETYEQVERSRIPSLSTICASLFASLLLRNHSVPPSRLLSLPPSLFQSICEIVAKDYRGSEVLVRIQKENSDLGLRIPTSVWVDAIAISEQKTRNFTYSSNAFAVEYEHPLIDVFAEYDSFVIEPVDEFEESVTKFIDKPRTPGVPSIANRTQFLQQFKQFTNDVFDGFDMSNVIIIGGSVIGSLLPNLSPSTSPEDYKADTSPFKASDVDVYVYGLDIDGFVAKVRALYNHLKAKLAPIPVYIAKSTERLVFYSNFPYRHIQISLVEFGNIWHVLTGADIDCSAFAFDGKTLWASPRARMAVNRRWTIANPELSKIRGTPQYEFRMAKYADRGFSIVDPEFHLYKKPKLDKAPYIARDYCSTSGSSMLYAMQIFPEFAKLVSSLSSGGGLPFGPTLGHEEIVDYMETTANESDEGYGPSDTCLQEVSEEEAFDNNDLNLARESPFSDQYRGRAERI